MRGTWTVGTAAAFVPTGTSLYGVAELFAGNPAMAWLIDDVSGESGVVAVP